MDTGDIRSIPWQDAAAVLLRRRRVILAVFAGGVATAVVITYLMGPKYKAAATLMVTANRARVAVSPEENLRPTVDEVTEGDLNSEVALLKSTALVREVLEPYREQIEHDQEGGALQPIVTLLHFPIELPGLLYRAIHRIPARSAFDDYVEATADLLSVTPITKSHLIEVAYVASAPEWTADFVNKLVWRHLERQAEISQQSEALRFFEKQQQVLAETLRQAQGALRAFYVREGLVSVPTQRETLGDHLADVESTLTQSRAELAESAAKAAFLIKEIPSHPKQLVSDPRFALSDPVELVKTRVVQLELQRSELLPKFAPTSLTIHGINRQIAAAREVLAKEKKSATALLSGVDPTRQTLEVELAEAQAQVAAVTARIDALQADARSIRAQFDHLDQIASEQDRLEQEVAAAKDSLITYLHKQEEARFSHALDESQFVNVTVAEPASVPVVPEVTTRQLAIVLAAVMSLLAGIGAAVVRDRIDPTIKGVAEAADVTGLPILGNIPAEA